ncbi:hypothetical protein ACFOE1_11660 [Agromyces mediolanus]|uniref:WxL domain-containing protein n=1 Tax=Agromyces mediolanus TaxID=41986 RepID=A0A918CBF8_AGRME|nr:hypothetical protein [Agromyces mediolanus]GGR13747.1 hypothetical protein GCM10010196_02880 [Agromyces mediolanus]GLJ72692.1 hypothetical protein GCM10017583_19480 [Agromyces mediolanus]
MMYPRLLGRACAVGAGTVLLLGVAGMAAAEENHGENDVDVTVEIADTGEPGVLAMTVAGTSTTLTEDGSTATERQFTGTLPTVTVTDTRTPDEIAPGAYWYVLGTASDFTGDAGQPAIGAGHLGWAPKLIDGGDSGLVSEGDVVDTVMDTDDPDAELPFGLVDQELLAMGFDSAALAPEGQWTANAQLFLRTPATVAPGSYTAKLTLSLFE